MRLSGRTVLEFAGLDAGSSHQPVSRCAVGWSEDPEVIGSPFHRCVTAAKRSESGPSRRPSTGRSGGGTQASQYAVVEGRRQPSQRP
jgi:hypothetical protein